MLLVRETLSQCKIKAVEWIKNSSFYVLLCERYRTALKQNKISFERSRFKIMHITIENDLLHYFIIFGLHFSSFVPVAITRKVIGIKIEKSILGTKMSRKRVHDIYTGPF